MSDYVFVERDEKTYFPVRIFKNIKAAFDSDLPFTEMLRSYAVGSIRHQCFVRSQGFCELCPCIITENGCHMHERLHRGRFDVDGRSGEISTANSVVICAKCHKLQHPEREIKFTRRQS